MPAAKERLANFKKRLSPEQLKEAEAFVLANRATPGAGVPAAVPDKAEAAEKPKARETPAKPAKPASKDKR